jgi:hypothetical protein
MGEGISEGPRNGGLTTKNADLTTKEWWFNNKKWGLHPPK